ncbi:hypothetical protein CO058_02470 [candidate division WWE3 bacterium CG_4_9_14_0_2_um_filter_35_11]|uniref:Uncharacterized protein n=1 Tax=candidate division WWE3 bacterium CG_4_9_14_0_2_um_filter_35_11 TaxID=1975077 RepID=A0A2M8ELI1_UNCKA|nr:MAG: hypothetical protein COV25_02730 [candidate division WWE3 bacterium CG10_big_fil_rev_8_21_14_0_10_35_32]PJC23599.1 MAG: hypothetical protein CO058_02470 [candidate division WWE3 bacterium CG_4_9_14_0_2_um_filter_35_11]
MESIAQVLANLKSNDSGKYLSQEWQLYGYRLAMWLGDTERVSMYMKLAKNEDRDLLQKAWDFVKDSKARSKPRLFLWKLTQLKKV